MDYTAQTAWNREHTLSISLKLNRRTDADIIDWLSERRPQTEIKRLIRDEIERSKRKELG